MGKVQLTSSFSGTVYGLSHVLRVRFSGDLSAWINGEVAHSMLFPQQAPIRRTLASQAGRICDHLSAPPIGIIFDNDTYSGSRCTAVQRTDTVASSKDVFLDPATR